MMSILYITGAVFLILTVIILLVPIMLRVSMLWADKVNDFFDRREKN